MADRALRAELPPRDVIADRSDHRRSLLVIAGWHSRGVGQHLDVADVPAAIDGEAQAHHASDRQRAEPTAELIGEVAEVIEGVRRRMFDTFLQDSPFAPLLTGNPKFEISVRGWIGFVEFTTIDWCVNPRLSRVELRDLLTEILFEVLRVVAPPVFRTQ